MKTNTYLSKEERDNNKILETISQDLDKQPFDLWLQDLIQQLLGKPTKFFLSSYGTMANNQPKKRNQVSFLMDQDLVVEVTVISSNIHLTRHGILMTFLRTISDPYPLITSVCNTISVSVWTCIESLTSILSSLCKVLTHLITVSSEFLSYYDDETLKNEFWKAWDALNIIFWSNSYGLHLLIVLRILFVYIMAIITWSLFSPRNHQDDSPVHTAVYSPSSDDTELVVEEVLTGVNNKEANEHQNPAGFTLVSSLSETSVSSDCSKDSQTSGQSRLCQHHFLLHEDTSPAEEEDQDDLLEDPLLPRPFLHDNYLFDPSGPLEVMPLPYDSTTLSETAGSYDADDEACEETDDEPFQHEFTRIAPRNFLCESLMMLWAYDMCQVKGFFINPYWRLACSVPEVLKVNKHVSSHNNRPCALAKLAESQYIRGHDKVPTFGQWIFSGKINPYWVFQSEWPIYTWSTSCFLPIITGNLMRGLPWKDVIYFPGGFITPCPAFNYRTEPLVYQS